MYFGQMRWCNRSFNIYSESMHIYMSPGRLKRTTSTVMMWIHKRKMRKIIKSSDIYIMEGEILCCRIYKRLDSLNKHTEDLLDGIDIEIDFKLNTIHVRLFMFELE